MILNRIDDPLVDAWVTEIDSRLPGCRMLAYGDELVVERGGRASYLRVPWGKMASDLRNALYPDGLFAQPVDLTELYLSSLARMIDEEMADLRIKRTEP